MRGKVKAKCASGDICKQTKRRRKPKQNMRRRVSSSPLLLLLRSTSPLPLLRSKPFSTSSPPLPPLKPSAALTAAEISEINSLIPRLCDAGRHHDAVRLISISLLADPPLSSLPLSDLSHRLAALPDLAPTMSLLTALRHHPRRPSPIPFCSLLISSYFQNHRLREAAKVFAWLCRPDSPSRPDPEVYRITVQGFCEHRRALEAMKVLREMVRDGVSPEREVRSALYRSLLWEALVDEAKELDAVLGDVEEEEGGDGFRRAAELIDRIIGDWEKL